MSIFVSCQNAAIHSSIQSGTEDRIEWYYKHCRKTGRFCTQLRQAKSDAVAEYRHKMSARNKNLRIEQQIVKNIKLQNPGIGQHLANNMKDYILLRLKEDF